MANCNKCVDIGTIVAIAKKVGGGGGNSNAVKYTPQSLTSAQQEQARTNISAPEVDTLGRVVNPTMKQQIDANAIIEDGAIVCTIDNPQLITLLNNVAYEFDILLPVSSITETLAYDLPIYLMYNTDKIVINNILSRDITQDTLYGEMQDVVDYDPETGFRWVFDATYSEITENNVTTRSISIAPTVSKTNNGVLVISNATMLDAITEGEVLYGCFKPGQIVIPSDDNGYQLGHPYQYQRSQNQPYSYDWLDISDESWKPTIMTNSGTGAQVVPGSNNVEYRFLSPTGISALTLNTRPLPGTTTLYDFTVIFRSGTTATTFTNSLNAYFGGYECSGGVFKPIANAVYQLSVWWNGLGWYGSAVRLNA